MASIKFILDIRKNSKSDMHNICLQLLHNRETRDINLGVKIKKEDFKILENGTIKLEKVNYLSSITRTTNFLNKKKSEADDILENLRLQGKLDSLSILELKRLISQNKSDITLTDFMLEQVKMMRQSKRFGTADCKEQAVSLLRRYTKRNEVTFEEVNYNFLKKMESWWLGNGNAINGLGPKLRDIRNAFNEASKDSRILYPKSDIPFSAYKIKKTKPNKRSISIDMLKKFYAYEPRNDEEQLAKDFFVFSFTYAGMNPIDICMLKIKNICTGRLMYNRAKVKDASFNWEIGPDSKDILDRYTFGKGRDKFVFPVITDPFLEGDALRKHIKSRMKRLNSILLTIAENAEMGTHLTTYVARHTWSTLAKKKGIPVASISDALGHQSLKTTENYLADLEDDELNAVNKQVYGMMFEEKKSAPGNQPDADKS